MYISGSSFLKHAHVQVMFVKKKRIKEKKIKKGEKWRKEEKRKVKCCYTRTNTRNIHGFYTRTNHKINRHSSISSDGMIF